MIYKGKPPPALTEEQIKDVEKRAEGFPFYSLGRHRVLSLCAMARERNEMVAEKAKQQSQINAALGLV